MKSYSIRTGSKSNDWFSYRDIWIHSNTGKKAIWLWRQRFKWCIYKPMNARVATSHQQLQRGKNGVSPEEHDPPDTLISDFNPPRLMGVNFCCLAIQFVVMSYSLPRKWIQYAVLSYFTLHIFLSLEVINSIICSMYHQLALQLCN